MLMISKKTMDPAKAAELSALLGQESAQSLEGKIVKGLILEIREDVVLVDVSGKSEASIPVTEWDDASALKVGDEVDVLVCQNEDENGTVKASKKMADDKIRWEAVFNRYPVGSVVKGKIVKETRGGLDVDVDGVKAFLPGSQIDVVQVKDVTPLIGQEFEFKLIKIAPERHNIIVSRRELLQEAINAKRAELLGQLVIGEKRIGKVKNITSFGAFIDLGGIDGLLHNTDLSWAHVKDAAEVLKIGEEIEVVVLNVEKDREPMRISLGRKQLEENPWDTIDVRFPIGTKTKGTVVNLAEFGAFVQIERGLEGLVHVSEFSWTGKIKKPDGFVKVGDEVEVMIIDIDKSKSRLSLSMKQCQANPWSDADKRYPVGSRVKGKVRNFTTYGAFIELEQGIDGMVHVGELAWGKKINHPSEVLQKGQEVEAIVLDVDTENERISLSLKDLQDDPWTTLVKDFAVGQMVKGKVSKTATFGAFVALGEGVDGLIHISQLSENRVEKVTDVVKVGDEVEARIVKIEKDQRRIGLSLRPAGSGDDENYELPSDYKPEAINTIKPGEALGSLGSAFDQVLGGEEWTPEK